MTDTTETEAPIKPKLGNKRKAAKVTREMVAPMASVEPLTIENMVLKANGTSKVHFKRLKYKGCPALSNKGLLKENTQYIDMKRDDFVREMYRLLKPNFNRSKKTYFDNLCKYIRWLDSSPHEVKGDYFANNLTKLSMEDWGARVSQGKTSKGSWSLHKGMLSAVLKLLNRHADAARLAPITGAKASTKPHKTLHVESELKPTVKALFRGYIGLAKYVDNGATPDINPLWDETLFNAQAEKHGWAVSQRVYKRSSFKKNVIGFGDWRNQLTRLAAMICFMFTGMNTKPLLGMKRKDVVFKQVQGGKYIFDATKGRAGDREIDNGIGFSTYARRFIESWLSLSATITGTSGDAPLFPWVTKTGEISDFNKSATPPQKAVNRLLKILGLSEITASILRKTKLDTLMKVTEDIYLVSISGNNSIVTVQKSYSSGNEQDHKRNLSASTEATYNLAKGTHVEDAVSAAKYAHHDVLSEYDYKRLRKKEHTDKEAMTPLGVRCQDNTKGAASIIDKVLKKSGIEMPGEEQLCTDFLECFECEYHKLVAGVEDIWLMLSFKDTLKDMEQFPAINSFTKSRYQHICLTIDSVLARYKEVSVENYSEALEKMKDATHPLYATAHSVNDLLEVFS